MGAVKFSNHKYNFGFRFVKSCKYSQYSFQIHSSPPNCSRSQYNNELPTTMPQRYPLLLMSSKPATNTALLARSSVITTILPKSMHHEKSFISWKGVCGGCGHHPQ
ncbi:hypothetical protein BDW22DRAFT_772670 [Trametopsis cervina]|nr:hypothetical protein BDW22DRAFT_772670 [Trametopsis cervina]